jgi:hypothetical protein
MHQPSNDQIINSPQWLTQFSCNVVSQFGEDGIIEKIMQIISITDQWCVEFGAWDGKHLSNTYNLIENKKYSAVLIEPDAKRFKALKNNYATNPQVYCLQQMVGYDAPNHLDAILSATPIPKDFDLLSIDIDGNDFHVWQAMGFYRPKVIVIEYNPTIPNTIDFVQPKKSHLTQGCSLKALVRLAKSKNYELIAVTTTNGIFVEQQYFPLFNISKNEPEDMRTDSSLITYLFTGYDGTVFLGGNTRMNWHDINMLERRSQQLPWFLRRFPERYNWVQRKFASIYFRFRK